ncbi:NAD-dependent epimerase/dehydratase family protein [Rubrivirga litoralis]|uniref:NAD-dependent epimerase/dehydratase domain-containing protein n=2 Tax=Rubrivirga TaxID=1434037 RepID=A0ABU3BSL4_9BACT|nr:NAD-dependent epimerase/dehydratase family protein [Rubrivirga sp. F394]MDT0632269.1 hypothetical protein [Rubrivirga sp. F394]
MPENAPDRSAAPPVRSAVLLGGTGLVGGHVLRLLARDGRWGRVVTLGRRPMEPASHRHEDHVVDFDRLADSADLFRCDDLFCCLGTTKKQAGSKEAFRRVDLEIPAEAARLARAGGAAQGLLVSALGADADSRIFYNRTKGEAEEAFRDAGFEAVQVVRPSLLTGDRDEVRPGERAAEAVLGALRPALVGPLRRLRPTPAVDVARALVAIAAAAPPGDHAYGPRTIAWWARHV